MAKLLQIIETDINLMIRCILTEIFLGIDTFFIIYYFIILLFCEINYLK